jgi:predicted regulator of Ras-like GTPase activity (Roadblock/LC7/MglB family)
MSFLHWFKRKPESSEEAEAKTVLTQKIDTEQANTPEPIMAGSRPETGSASLGLPDEYQAAEAQSISPGPEVAPEPTASENKPPLVAPQLSVPIGAFYEKLPAHLLTSKKPDLRRTVQIAEQDVVLDSEAQEATLSLSILSLSCPDIFIRAVDDADDVPITFSIEQPEKFEPSTEDGILIKESDTSLPTAATAPVSTVDAVAEKEIRVRLEPVLCDFPPELETPSIRSLIETQAEIALPWGLIQPQLVHGRVVVPAEIFCRGLPSDLKPHFAAIDSTAEIPIPLREIFAQLPAEAIKLRDDQETDAPEEMIPTPFTAHAEEDAKRFREIPAIATAPANVAPQPKVEPPRIGFERNSKRLQSLFMTEEPLDLTRTIQKVAELPGLRACVLSTIDGLKLAGGLEDPDREKAISAFLPELFQHTRSNLEQLGTGALETITLSYHLHQLSTFVQGELCLTVFHDNRPFKPGVREKIQAVISELSALSASGKNL